MQCGSCVQENLYTINLHWGKRHNVKRSRILSFCCPNKMEIAMVISMLDKWNRIFVKFNVTWRHKLDMLIVSTRINRNLYTFNCPSKHPGISQHVSGFQSGGIIVWRFSLIDDTLLQHAQSQSMSSSSDFL